MSYFEKIRILSADSPSIDAFGRWRASEPTTLFDSKFIHGSSSVFWSEKIVGNATSSYNVNSASIYLNVSNISGSSVTRQSRRYLNYQPGKSQLIMTTTVVGAGQSGVVKRFGYFDNNNGLCFMQTGSSFGCCLRSTSTTGTPVDTFYSQSDWNLDKMNGTGPSGLTIDNTKSQLYFIDFEWLGVGRVRWGMFLGGNAYYVHELSHINTLNGVYMSTPNLPIRYEITNYGSATPSTLSQICSTVISEGGREQTGIGISINNGVTPLSVPVGPEYVLLAWRKDPDQKGIFIIPHEVTLATPDANDGLWRIWVNPITSSNLSWQYNSTGRIQWASGSTVLASSGSLVSSGYIVGGTTTTAGTVGRSSIEHFQGLGFDVNGNPDTLVLTIQSIGGTNTWWASWDAQVET